MLPSTSGDGNAGANPAPAPTENVNGFGESIVIGGTDWRFTAVRRLVTLESVSLTCPAPIMLWSVIKFVPAFASKDV